MSLKTAYLALLEIPHTDKWRLMNDDIYARLRNAISDQSGKDNEEVQTSYEYLANMKLSNPGDQTP
jgi:hypothetical protein